MRSTETAKRRKNTDIYRRAARLIENNKADMSCWAINQARTNGREILGRSPQREKYENTFVIDAPDGHFGPNNEENRGVRIVALCFMAAMVEAGDA